MDCLQRHLALFMLLFLVLPLHSVEATVSGFDSQLALLKLNMVGPEVVFLQDCLTELGFLDGPSDGEFGPATYQGVLNLQQAMGLSPDGIVGNATWEKLQELVADNVSIHVVQPGDTLWAIARRVNVTVSDLAAANSISNPDRLAVGVELVIPKGRSGSGGKRTTPIRLVHWDEVNRIFPKSTTATILDLQSGLRFQVRRLFGTYHADVEPLSAADTRTMKKAIGGKWSWERRPIAVECSGLRIAASMNGYPHGRSTIGDNAFAGHFCIHFQGSRLHSGGRVDKEHQAAVMQAVGYNQDVDRALPTR